MVSETEKDIMGTGWSFPVRIDGRGGIALSKHENDIQESIRIIIGTAKGERRMRPDFGCEIHDLVFAPNNATTRGLAAHYIEDALGWWEPRIEVIDINTEPDPGNTGKLLITISYRIRATNDERNLVYPFYIVSEGA